MKKILFVLLALAGSHASYAQFTATVTNDTICAGETVTLSASFATPGVTPTVISLSDDQFSGVINIGFPFTYYGNTYSQCLISSNFYISFNTALAGGFSPWSITGPVPTTTPTQIMNSVLGPWQDVNPGLGGTISYATVGTAPNRMFIVNFDNIPMFSCTSLCFSSQIRLYETTNVIETHIASKSLCLGWNGGQAIHATHNPTGTIANVVPGRNAGMTWTTSTEGMQFTPTSSTSYSITPITFSTLNLGISGTISWYTGGTLIGTGPTLNVTPTATTSYVATFTNPCGGVIATDTVTVVAGAPFNFAGSTVINSSCSSSTGTVLLAVNDGSGSYSFSWNDPASQTTQNATGLAPGTYMVIVNDLLLNCSLDTSFVIDDNNTLTLSVTGITPVACYSDSNGTATANITGGVGTVNISWSNGETGSSATMLSGGSHTVTVTDSDGCTASTTFVTPSPASLDVTMNTLTHALCFGTSTGVVNINVSGGTGPFTYLWDNSGASTVQDLIGVPAGTYTVVVTDAGGCTGTLTATVTQPSQVTGTAAITHVSCNGANDGAATITPAGGSGPYTYEWLGYSYTTPNVTGLAPGNYTVMIQDVNNCPGTVMITITQPAPMIINITGGDAECGVNNGTGTTTVAGGLAPYTYLWSNGETGANASALPSGLNNLTVTDANGCTGTGTVTIGEYFNMDVSATADPTFGVIPQVVNFTGTTPGAYGYVWDFGDGSGFTAFTTSNTASYTYTEPGIYTITVVAYNAGLCSDTTVLSVEVVNESILIMPNIITPNGDNTNDEFVPNEARYIVSYECTIYNRWGIELFKTTSLADGWKPGDAAEGTYFYLVVATGIDHKTHKLQGTVTVSR